MTTPAYPNQIRMSQIRAEARKPTTNQDLSLGGFRAGQGKVAAGAIGYPEGIRTEIPSSGAISMGNFHSYSNFPELPGPDIVQHFWDYQQNYFRYGVFNTGTDNILRYPVWKRGAAAAAGSGEMLQTKEAIRTSSDGGMVKVNYNVYFNGQDGGLNNADGSLPVLSEWTTAFMWTCGWKNVYNNRGALFPAFNAWAYGPDGTGEELLAPEFRYSSGVFYGDYQASVRPKPNSFGFIEDYYGPATPVAPFPAGMTADDGGFHFNVWWIPRRATDIKRCLLEYSSSDGGANPISYGMFLIPGKWTQQQKHLDMYGEQGYSWHYLYCRVYRDNNTSAPFRIQTTTSTYTVPRPHRFNEYGDNVTLPGYETKFKKWRFNTTNTSTMAPIVTNKEYDVDWINDSEFYIRDPLTGDYVYPTVSSAATFVNANGGHCRKSLGVPAGAIQIISTGRSNSGVGDSFAEFNTNYQTSTSWASNRGAAVGGNYADYHPQELPDRKIMTVAIEGSGAGDHNTFKITYNPTSDWQINTWKCTPSVMRRFWLGTQPNSTIMVNLTLSSLN